MIEAVSRVAKLCLFADVDYDFQREFDLCSERRERKKRERKRGDMFYYQDSGKM